MILGDVIDEATREDGLVLKLLAMDSGAFRVSMGNPPGRIEVREYKTVDYARHDFDRIKAQEQSGCTHLITFPRRGGIELTATVTDNLWPALDVIREWQQGAPTTVSDDELEDAVTAYGLMQFTRGSVVGFDGSTEAELAAATADADDAEARLNAVLVRLVDAARAAPPDRTEIEAAIEQVGDWGIRLGVDYAKGVDATKDERRLQDAKRAALALLGIGPDAGEEK